MLVIPVLNIYRKYYGWKTAGFLLITMYAAMVAAALVVEGLFGAAGLIPHEYKARIIEASAQWNYTTILNIVFGALSAPTALSILPNWWREDDSHDEPLGRMNARIQAG